MTNASKLLAYVMLALLVSSIALTYHRTMIAHEFEIVDDVIEESETASDEENI